MKIYKYRDFSQPDEVVYARLEGSLRHREFWCARPDTLNDPNEFSWKCDFSVSPSTVRLLTELLVQEKGHPTEEAHSRAVGSINAGRIEILTEPFIAGMIQQCREEIGLVCFGTSEANETLWERYAGAGAGLCIEVEVPDSLFFNKQLHLITYSDDRRIHLDTLLRARLNPQDVAQVFAVSLLSKSSSWEPEEEIRFISKRQQVNVVIEGSEITRVIIGPAVAPARTDLIRQIAGDVPVVPRHVG